MKKGDQSIPLGIGKYCHIRRAIIDKNVRIGNNVKILNERGIDNADGDYYHIREGIVIIPKNAVIPEGAVI
jgi:glucose-1-phosphate adenylyltransferase